MNIVTKPEELVGKKIAFAHLAQFSEYMTLATDDGSLMMSTFEMRDDESVEIRMLYPHAVLEVLKSPNNNWLRTELSELGIFDMEAYREEQKRLTEERQAIWKSLQRWGLFVGENVVNEYPLTDEGYVEAMKDALIAFEESGTVHLVKKHQKL